jgi:ribosomal protein S18 acetylase RimI-like enzyme
MDKILDDFSTAALAGAIKGNLYEFFRYFEHSSKAEMHHESGLVYWHTRIQHPWFNGVVSNRLPANQAGPKIQEIMAYFKSRGVTGFTWWIQSEVEPGELGRQLLTSGFVYRKNTPGMAVDLMKLNERGTYPKGLRIERVKDFSTLMKWARTMTAGFPLPESWENDMLSLFLDVGFDLPLRHYLGYLNGRPVSTASLFLGAGVAGIYNIATVFEARKQGVGAALTLAPLREARKMGYRVGVLQSSEMGFGLYKELGFEKYCDMDHYFWAEEGE